MSVVFASGAAAFASAAALWVSNRLRPEMAIGQMLQADEASGGAALRQKRWKPPAKVTQTLSQGQEGALPAGSFVFSKGFLKVY